MRREFDFGHDDARERGRLLANIDGQANARTLFRDEIHTLLDLPPGSLDDGSLTTERLRQVLDAVRELPNVPMNLSGRHRFVPLTVSP